MRTRWAALAAVIVVALAALSITIALRSGEEETAAKGEDLTALMCPQTPRGRAGAAPEPAPGAFDTSELIGLTLADARAKAAEHTCAITVSLQDGQGRPVPITEDPKRIYVFTEKGVVTEIEGVGGGI